MSTREKVQVVIIVIFTLSLIGVFPIQMLNLDSGEVNWSAILIGLSAVSFIVGLINAQEINKADELKKVDGK